jgi:hypothetical protein
MALQTAVGLALGIGAWLAYSAATTDLVPSFSASDTIALVIPMADEETTSMLTLSEATPMPGDSESPGFGLGMGVARARVAESEGMSAWVVAEGPAAISALRRCQQDLGLHESKPSAAIERLWQWGGSEHGAYREGEMRSAVYFSIQASASPATKEASCLLPVSSVLAKSSKRWTLQTPRLITVWGGGSWANTYSKRPFGCVEVQIPSVQSGFRRDYLSPDDFTERARTSSGSPDYLQMCGDPSVSSAGARTVLPAVAASYFQITAESLSTGLIFASGAILSLGLGLLVDVGNKLLNRWVEQAERPRPSQPKPDGGGPGGSS